MAAYYIQINIGYLFVLLNMSNKLILTPVKLNGVSTKGSEIWIPEDETPRRNRQNSIIVKIGSDDKGNTQYKIKAHVLSSPVRGIATNNKQARLLAARKIEEIFQHKVRDPDVTFNIVRSKR